MHGTAYLRLATLAAMFLALTGCDQIENMIDRAVDKRIAKIQEKHNSESLEMKNRLATNDQRVAQIEIAQHSLQVDAVGLKWGIESLTSAAASVSTEQRSYALARNEHGIFPVIVAGIRPHLDGFMLSLEIGNYTSARFSGAKIDLGWGLPWDANGRTIEEIRASQRTRSVSVTQVFNAGTYTPIDVSLTPAKADEVKRITVKMTFDNLALARPTPQR